MLHQTFRPRSYVPLLLTAFAFALSTSSYADVTLPSLLADHMVIQRGFPVHLWGMAAPSESVAVTFRGETKSTNADELGRWSLYLSPGEAGGPFQITVKAANTITLNDVLVGDVWVASGQSNMEFPMKELTNADAEIANRSMCPSLLKRNALPSRSQFGASKRPGAR
jgi:sialate O-acetylesterase